MSESVPDDRALREKVRDWSAMHHITIALLDTSELLRRVADAIDELGCVDVYDVTFKPDDELRTKRVTVYFMLRDDADASGDAD